MIRSSWYLVLVLVAGVAFVPATSNAFSLFPTREEVEVGRLLRNASLYLERGDYKTAIQLIEEARRKPTFKDNLATITPLTRAYIAIGRYDDAMALVDRIEEGKFESKLSPDNRKHIASIFRIGLHTRMGRCQEAQKEILPLWEALNSGELNSILPGIQLADFEYALAALFLECGDHTNGLRIAKKAYDDAMMYFADAPFSEERKNRFRELAKGTYLAMLGKVSFDLGHYGEALQQINSSRASARLFISEDTKPILKVDRLRIQALNRLGRHEEALKGLETTLPTALKVLGETDTVRVSLLAEQGYTLLLLGRLQEAARSWELLVPAAEKIRAEGSASPNDRRALFGEWVSYYRMLANAHFKLGNVERAFELAELSKARTLLESLASHDANESELLAADEKNALKQLGYTLSAIGNQLLQQSDASKRLELEIQERDVRAKLAGMRAALTAKYPKFAEMNNVKIVSRADAELLPPKTAFVSYLVVPHQPFNAVDAESEVIAFVLTGNDEAARIIPLGQFNQLSDAVQRYRQELSNGNSSPHSPLAKMFAERLVTPLIPALGNTTEWIISPDAGLSLLPFETLPVGGEPLIATRDIGYIQSLSVLARVKARQKAYRSLERQPLFAMGAAIYTTDTGPAPARTAQDVIGQNERDILKVYSSDYGNPAHTAAMLSTMNVKWVNLPGTEKEIAAVTELFPGSAIYMKENATEAKLLELNKQGELTRYRYLLFAAHGYLSTEVPELSALVLGQVNKAPGTDGFITAAKWSGYNIKSDLIVMSACNTGVGKVILGEGVMGLPYALYVAGNRSTVMSLWPVSDIGTSKFMQGFFSRLKAGMSQTQALSETKREFIKHKDFGNPFYWAPFVLYGL
jgi:CHAT domain-containing protein